MNLAEEFNARLSAVEERARSEASELVLMYRQLEKLEDDQPVSFADDPNVERTTDDFALLSGWINDRLHGINRLHRQSVTKKIRRALGYNVERSRHG